MSYARAERPAARGATTNDGTAAGEAWRQAGTPGEEAPLRLALAAPGARLRRACAGCGDDEEQRLRRSAQPGGGGPALAPPSVQGVLRSPGTPLDPAARAALEPRVGTSLAAIRVHADARAAESARAVGARAYTVGQHVAFARGEYAPHTPAGRRLLLHEIAHTVQQRGAPAPPAGAPLEVGPARDPAEAEADAFARSAAADLAPAPVRGAGPVRLRRDPDDLVEVELVPTSPAQSAALAGQGVQLPGVSPQTWSAIGGTPYTTLLPGYSQQGDTCGAASLVTALSIWDREHWDPSRPNDRTVTAINLTLIALRRNWTAVLQRRADSAVPAVRSRCGGDRACIEREYAGMRDQLRDMLEQIRDDARQPGAQLTEPEYQAIGIALYFMWNEGRRPGLSSIEIENIQRSLGLYAGGSGSSSGVQSFDAIFTDPVTTGLRPDQFAQVAWLTNTGAHHAFLMGRLSTGEWFLSDQGPRPAAEFRASTLADLHSAVRVAALTGGYWLFVGTHSDFMARFPTMVSWTGVKLLAPQTAVEAAAQDIVPAGATLGEVDAGATTIGSTLTRGTFVAREYSLAAAQARFSGSTRGGGLIVELPRGVFSLYTTSAVSDANLSQTALDAADSSGAVLGRQSSFEHAWLILGTSSGRHGSWFSLW